MGLSIDHQTVDYVNLQLFCFQLTLVLNIYLVMIAFFARYWAFLVHFGVEVIYMLLNICSDCSQSLIGMGIALLLPFRLFFYVSAAMLL